MTTTSDNPAIDCRLTPAGLPPDTPIDYDIPDLQALEQAIADNDTPGAYAMIRNVCRLPEMCAGLCPGLSIMMPGTSDNELSTNGQSLREVYAAIAPAARAQKLTRLSLPATPAGYSAAVIGGGPAGIACAISLLEQGYAVSIIEMTERLGGVPQHVIRASRYAEAQTEIDAILAPALSAGRLQVMFHCELGRDTTLEELKNRHDAVMIATGLWQEFSLGAATGVTSGLSFLAQAKTGRRSKIPPRVAILAGGDSAMDAAVVANELGAQTLTVIFDGDIADMHWHLPGTWFESSGACCLQSTRVIAYETDSSGELTGIRIENAADDKDSGTQRILPADLVIEAMGLRAGDDIRRGCGDLRFRSDGLVHGAGHGSYATSMHGVFAAGAILNGGASVGRCVAEGMQAAASIQRFLSSGKTARQSSQLTNTHATQNDFKLQSCPKLHYGRSVAPEETVARLETVIADRYDYELVEESLAEHLHWTALFIDNMDFLSMGKGIHPVLSKAGALAECAEWLSSLETSEMPGFTICHQDELAPCLRIEDLLTHVETAGEDVIQAIKDSDCAHYWVDGYSLRDERPIKVPIDFVRRINAPNGLASGNRIEEAIVHATNEIFERRALITVLRNRMVVPTIDAESIENPIIRSQLDFMKDKGIEVFLKDLSFGGELPCIGAYFVDPNIPDTHQFHHFLKAGASFSTEDALIRTFTEYVQGRRLDEFIPGAPEEQKRVLEHDFRQLRCMPDDGDNFLSSFLFGFVPLRNAAFLRAGDRVPFRPTMGYDDCLEDIESCKTICKKLEKDYVIVDCTDEAIGFPVVQVIVPGYSDILPYHPDSSRVMFEGWTRESAIRSYER